MNDAFNLMLTIFLVALVILSALWTLVIMFVAWKIIQGARRIRRIQRIVNSAIRNHDAVINFDRDRLSPNEAEQVRDFLRRSKEREARDADTIDKATEYQSDFEPPRDR